MRLIQMNVGRESLTVSLVLRRCSKAALLAQVDASLVAFTIESSEDVPQQISLRIDQNGRGGLAGATPVALPDVSGYES